MQTASGKALKDSPNRNTGAGRARGARRRLRPITLAIAAFLGLVSLGIMVAVFVGLRNESWPPRSSDSGEITVKPTRPEAAGLRIEKVGEPVREDDRVTVVLRVTNQVEVSGLTEGTEGGPTPTPAPANVKFGNVKVVFYREDGERKEIVGSGIGEVAELPYGESKEISVYAIPVGEFTDYEAYPDTVWTDRDPVKTEGES